MLWTHRWGVVVWLYFSLISALNRGWGGWVSNVIRSPLYFRERPSAQCVGPLVGPRAGVEGCGKSSLHPVSNPNLAVRSCYQIYSAEDLAWISLKWLIVRKSVPLKLVPPDPYTYPNFPAWATVLPWRRRTYYICTYVCVYVYVCIYMYLFTYVWMDG
jgi:hypothetical protein